MAPSDVCSKLVGHLPNDASSVRLFWTADRGLCFGFTRRFALTRRNEARATGKTSRISVNSEGATARCNTVIVVAAVASLFVCCMPKTEGTDRANRRALRFERTSLLDRLATSTLLRR